MKKWTNLQLYCNNNKECTYIIQNLGSHIQRMPCFRMLPIYDKHQNVQRINIQCF